MSQNFCPKPLTTLINKAKQSRPKILREKCSQKQAFVVSRRALRYSSLGKSWQMSLIKRQKQLNSNVCQKLSKLKFSVKSPY